MLSSLALPKFSSYNSKSGINLGFFSKGYSKLFRETRCQHQVFGSETDITKIISFGMPENFPSFLFMTTCEKADVKDIFLRVLLLFAPVWKIRDLLEKVHLHLHFWLVKRKLISHRPTYTEKCQLQQPSFKSCLYHTSIKTPKMPLFEENRSLMPFNSV